MYALMLTLLIYLSHFAPWAISRPLFFLPMLSFFALCTIRSIEQSLQTVVIAVLFYVISSALSAAMPSSALCPDDIVAVYGRVIQDSSQKKNRMTGYRLLMEAAEDRRGTVVSARGSVYILSGQADVLYGDRVRVSGYSSGDIFIGETELLDRPFSAELRAKAISWIRRRLRSEGAGELAMLLVLGTGEDGSYSLADDARLSGLSHVLALSGMHLSILASMLSVPLSIVPWKKLRDCIILLFLLFFSFLSGWRPSLVRALLFRIFLSMRFSVDEAFMISAQVLFSLFPHAIADLGAEYSYISLAAIFLLSSRIDRGIRCLLPVPPSLSISASASISALLFSVPLTLCTFGSYQLGAIITSLPLTAMISFYMGLSILVLMIPPLSFLLQPAYRAAEWLFQASSLFPELTSLAGYAALAALSTVLYALGLLSSSHVEPELQQHKRNNGGPIISRTCDD